LKTFLLEFNLPLKIFAVFLGVFAVVADQMTVSCRVLDRVLVTCFNVSEEHTASINHPEDGGHMFFWNVNAFNH